MRTSWLIQLEDASCITVKNFKPYVAPNQNVVHVWTDDGPVILEFEQEVACIIEQEDDKPKNQ